MQKEEFVSKIAEVVQNRMGKEYEITKTIVTKNNDVKKYGISVRKCKEAIAQVHYISDSYDPMDENVEKVAEDIMCSISNAQVPDDLKDLDVKEMVHRKDKVVLRLVNSTRNAEHLKNAPHRPFVGDLEIAYYMIFSMEQDGYATALINNVFLAEMQIDEEELYQTALQNTMNYFPCQIKSMSSVIMNMMGAAEEQEGI